MAVGSTQLRMAKGVVQQTQKNSEAQMSQGMLQLTELAFRMGQQSSGQSSAPPVPPPKKPMLALEDKPPESAEDICVRHSCQY